MQTTSPSFQESTHTLQLSCETVKNQQPHVVLQFRLTHIHPLIPLIYKWNKTSQHTPRPPPPDFASLSRAFLPASPSFFGHSGQALFRPRSSPSTRPPSLGSLRLGFAPSLRLLDELAEVQQADLPRCRHLGSAGTPVAFGSGVG